MKREKRFGIARINVIPYNQKFSGRQRKWRVIDVYARR